MTPFIGEIMMFGGTFAPRGWALCNGQLLAISQNTALFSILGTTYGGDGRTTFGLPELRGRIPMHAGNGPGLTPRPLGQKSGLQENHLNILTMAAHNHAMQVSIPVSEEDATTTEVGAGGVLSTISTDGPDDVNAYGPAGGTKVYTGGPLNVVVGLTGNNQGINNMAPYTCINYIIALTGTYPSRS